MMPNTLEKKHLSSCGFLGFLLSLSIHIHRLQKETMNIKKTLGVFSALLIASGLVLGGSAVAAIAAPSTNVAATYPNDAVRPFYFAADGLHAPGGFKPGEINLDGPGGLPDHHLKDQGINPGDFDYDPAHPGVSKYVGKTFISWADLGVPTTACITWAQLAGTTYHFGEDNTNRAGGVNENGWVFCISTPPTPPVTPVCVTAVWKIAAGFTSTNAFGGDQTLVGQYPRACGDLDVPTPPDCGTSYQIDSYNDNATTTALLAGGVLHSPNNPAESLTSVNPAYKYVDNPACVVPPVKPAPEVVTTPVETVDCAATEVKTTTTTATTDWVYDAITNTYVKGTPVITTTVTTRPATATECPVTTSTPTPTPTPTETATVPPVVPTDEPTQPPTDKPTPEPTTPPVDTTDDDETTTTSETTTKLAQTGVDPVAAGVLAMCLFVIGILLFVSSKREPASE